MNNNLNWVQALLVRFLEVVPETRFKLFSLSLLETDKPLCPYIVVLGEILLFPAFMLSVFRML